MTVLFRVFIIISFVASATCWASKRKARDLCLLQASQYLSQSSLKPSNIPLGEGKARVALVREAFEVPKEKNIAIAEMQLKGELPLGIAAISGPEAPKHASLAEISGTRHLESPGAHFRSHDTEIKILEWFIHEKNLKPDSQGMIRIFTERQICVSCNDMIEQFKRRFPGVKVIVSSAGLR